MFLLIFCLKLNYVMCWLFVSVMFPFYVLFFVFFLVSDENMLCVWSIFVMFDMLVFCLFSMFPFCLQSCFCLIWIMLKSDMWSSMFLLGFCLYVLLQYQVFSSIGQSLEFANSVGFWVGKSGVSVPSLSREDFFPHVSTTSIRKPRKHLEQIRGKWKRMLWPLDSASPE